MLVARTSPLVQRRQFEPCGTNPVSKVAHYNSIKIRKKIQISFLSKWLADLLHPASDQTAVTQDNKFGV